MIEKEQKYSGIDLDWDYANKCFYLSIPGYCREALTGFSHQHNK